MYVHVVLAIIITYLINVLIISSFNKCLAVTASCSAVLPVLYKDILSHNIIMMKTLNTFYPAH